MNGRDSKPIQTFGRKILKGRRALGRPRSKRQEDTEVDALYIGNLYDGGCMR
jgi:hypothetical protein